MTGERCSTRRDRERTELIDIVIWLYATGDWRVNRMSGT